MDSSAAKKTDLFNHDQWLEPEAARSVERTADGQWLASGSRPGFILRPAAGATLPVGDVRFEVELRGNTTVANATLRFDVGRGFISGLEIPLATTRGSRITALASVPEGTVAIGLDLDALGGFFLGPVRVAKLSAPVALLAHAFPAIRKVVRNPAQLAVLAARAARLFRYRGLKGVLARLRQGTLRATEDGDYQAWALRFGALDDTQREHLRTRTQLLRRRPTFSILLGSRTPSVKAMTRTVEALRSQLYPAWEICFSDNEMSSELRETIAAFEPDGRLRIIRDATDLAEVRGDWMITVQAGDAFAEHALFAVAEVLEHRPDLALVYADEDEQDEKGQRSAPNFKPDWSPELLRSRNYIGRAAFYRTERVRSLDCRIPDGEDGSRHGLLMRYAAGLAQEQVHHIPLVLLHRGSAPHPSPEVGDIGRHAIQQGLDARGVLARVEQGRRPGTYRVRYGVPQPPPRVSIIIPTRDRPLLLQRCLQSLSKNTAYQTVELVLVDNGSRDRKARALLDELARNKAARVLRYPPPFNYSAMNNLGVREASGEVLCFLNNDIEAISPEWLSEMVGLAIQPGVGAVGAKLLYPNDTVQHAGAVAGLFGVASHNYVREPREADGYLLQLQVTREVSAVTAACMVLRRERFLEVGGFDETKLRVAFSDIDLCFKLLRAGYRNLWTPHAELYHLESVSRGPDERPADRQRFGDEEQVMRARWQSVIDRDPFHSPNLSLDSNVPRPAWPPRVNWSWMGKQ